MRVRFVAVLAVLSGVTCAAGCRLDSDETPGPPSGDEPTAVDDAAVISVAVRHFSAQKVVFAFNGREAKTVILVHEESAGPAPIYLSDGQLRSDTRGEDWEVPADLREDLRWRNAQAIPLSDWKFSDGIVTADLSDERSARGADRLSGHPDAKAHVEVWLPGYSQDGRTVVVRFLFGPTPHGATATYLLVKSEGGWTVQKWAFAYYA